MQFHHKVFSAIKQNTSFNVQVICSIIRDIWKKKAKKVNTLTIKFNIPRNCKTFKTKVNFFVELGIYPRNRIAIPIKQNRNYQRFQNLINNGWICKTFGLTTDLQIVAYLRKEKEIQPRKNIMGIDVNAKYFAISVINPKGKILYQTYLGKHSSNYSLFKCNECGQVVNADRKASLAIAIKSLLERMHISNPKDFCIQISKSKSL